MLDRRNDNPRPPSPSPNANTIPIVRPTTIVSPFKTLYKWNIEKDQKYKVVDSFYCETNRCKMYILSTTDGANVWEAPVRYFKTVQE